MITKIQPRRPLARHLHCLEEVDLVRVAEQDPELSYLFRHALVQDVAYSSLLREDRESLHRLVAESLEGLYPEQREELAPQLGQHFLLAKQEARALPYLTEAAERASERYALQEALQLYQQALEVAKRLGEPRLALYRGLGRALELLGRYREAVELYESMGQEAEPELMLWGIALHGTVRAAPTRVQDLEQAELLCKEGLRLAQGMGQPAVEARLLWNLLLLYKFRDQPAQAVHYGEKALTLARLHDLEEQEAYLLNDLYLPYISLGEGEQAVGVLEQAIERWRALGNQAMLVDALSSRAARSIQTGHYGAGLAQAAEAGQLSEQINNLWNQAFSRLFVGLVYLDWGEGARAVEVMEQCASYAGEAGFVGARVMASWQLGMTYAYLGQIGHGLSFLQQAQSEIVESALPWQEMGWGMIALLRVWNGDLAVATALLERVRASNSETSLVHTLADFITFAEAELARAQRNFTRLLAITQRKYEVMQRSGERLFFPDVLYWQGRAYEGLGQPGAAWAALEAAQYEAEALEARRILWLILARRALLAEDHGQERLARRLREQAHETIHYIADHAPSPALRASFLARPIVRDVLEGTPIH